MTSIFCEFYKPTIPDDNTAKQEPKVLGEDTDIGSVELS
jgi:hypothetical protein